MSWWKKKDVPAECEHDFIEERFEYFSNKENAIYATVTYCTKCKMYLKHIIVDSGVKNK